MAEEVIDFTQSSRRILLNPIVPLSMLDIACRTGERAQATLLGKVYPSHIEIIEVIPMQYAENLKIDYQEHQRKLQAIQQIYQNLDVVGAVLTDIEVNSKEIPILHNIYNKQSGFRPQGILTAPVILSIGTSIKSGDFVIEAYSMNSLFRFCNELLGIVAFEKWNVRISFTESKIQEVSPIYSSFREKEIMPTEDVPKIVESLISNLEKIHNYVGKIIAKPELSDGLLGISLKRILSFGNLSKEDLNKMNQKSSMDMRLVVYLSTVINVNNLLTESLNKLQ